MNLASKRQAIRHLLNENEPGDATAVYYAFYHPDEKTQIFTYPPGETPASGYVAFSRTGIDLFRPLVTLRLPADDLSTSADLIHKAMQPGTAVILRAPAHYAPLLHALFEVHHEEQLRLYVLDQRRFEPLINVFVTQASSANDLPRFIIRARAGEKQVVASASLNWQSPRFAEISVSTNPDHRRQGWGRSVLSAMVQHLLDNGRQPLYVVAEQNGASQQLAESVGFVDSGVRQVMLQAIFPRNNNRSGKT